MKKTVSLLLAVFFLLIIISDFHFKCLRTYNLGYPKFTYITKVGIAISLIIVIIIFTKHSKHLKTYLTVFGLTISCLVSILLSYELFVNREAVIYIQAQYFFGLIVMFFFFNYYKLLNIRYLMGVIEFLIVINFILIVAGYALDLDIFKTYYNRFGYNGLFKSTSETSYFYVMTFILYVIKKRVLKENIMIVLIICSSLLVGSKTIYLFLTLVGLYYLNHYLVARKTIKNLMSFYLFFALILTLIGIGFYKILLPMNSVLYKVFVENGIVTTFFSFRNVLAEDAFNLVKTNFNVLNYLFGGIGYIPKTVELALIDMFLTFGILGSILFIWFLILNLPKINDKHARFLMALVAIVIILRGNFFYYPSVLYISIAIFVVILASINKNKPFEVSKLQ